MLKFALVLFWRTLSFLAFFFACVFALLGAAPLINNALYNGHKIFLSWLLVNFESANQWLYPCLFWIIAAGFLAFGIFRHGRAARVRNRQLEPSESAPIMRRFLTGRKILFGIIGLIIYLVLVGSICVYALVAQALNPVATLYEDRLSYQGHVYLLSVTPINEQVKQDPTPAANTYLNLFKFEVSQCDTSGWFCHVIYDASHTVSISITDYGLILTLSNLVSAHLRADAQHQRMLIFYQGQGASEIGVLIFPLPS